MDYTSIKVGQLPTAEISGSDYFPHEVAGLLKKATITDLAAFIGATDAIGFRAVSVQNGGTLPTTDKQEFILVGPGTYNNVGGGSTITVTEELNALVSNGTYWFVGVEIPIDAPPGNAVWGQIIGTLSNQTDLKALLDVKADLVDGKVPSSQLPSYVDDVVEVDDFAALPATGETGKIYVTLDSGFIYRWTGTIYVRIADEAPTWGTIVGTLGDQTDLQTALNLRVPYTGATGNVDLGSHKLTASDLVVNHSSGSGVAASITKGGNGEALTVVKNSGTGNAASITGGTTLISELNLTTDLADAYIASAATWNAKIGGSGNTNYLSKFTSSSAIGNSLLYDNGTNVFVGGSGSNSYKFNVVEGGTTLIGQQILMQNASNANEGLHVVHAGTGKLIKGTNSSGEVYSVSNAGIVKAGSYQLNGGTGNALYYGHTNKVVLANYEVGGGIDFETNGGNINMILNSNGNLGIGVDPSAWDTSWKVLQLSYGSLYSSIYSNIMAHNLYVAGEDTKYISTNRASQYEQNSGNHYWYTAPTGTAGTNVTLTPRMTLDNSGNLGIGTESSTAVSKFSVGVGNVTGRGQWASSAIAISNPTNIGAYSQISFGYTPSTTNASAYIGYLSTNQGANGYGDLVFGTRAVNTDTQPDERMRITSGGNVGIGTISPANKLDVYGGAVSTYMTVGRDTGFVELGAGLSQGLISSYNSSSVLRTLSLQGSELIFNSSTSATERMRITSGGNVGIGTSSPSENLTISKTLPNTSSQYGGVLGLSNGYYSCKIKSYQEYWLDLLGLTFETTYAGTSYERMRITSAGNVAIGKTIPDSKLDVEGTIITHALIVRNTSGNQQVSFNKSGSNRYAIGTEVGAGTTNDWSIYNYIAGSTSMIIYANNNYQFFGSNVSDIRAKENINSLDFNATEKIMALQPKSYYMKNDSKQIRYGLIAQEVNEVLPDLVCGDIEGDDFVGLDYNGVIPVLIKAIQELKAEIQTLKNK